MRVWTRFSRGHMTSMRSVSGPRGRLRSTHSDATRPTGATATRLGSRAMAPGSIADRRQVIDSGRRTPTESDHHARWDSDRGGATVLGCVAVTALIAVTLMIAQVGAVVVARHRVQAAADLGALAAAGALVAGTEVACAEAEEVVHLMSSGMRGCEVAEWDAVITAEGNVPIGLFGHRSVRAVARAGPLTDQQ